MQELDYSGVRGNAFGKSPPELENTVLSLVSRMEKLEADILRLEGVIIATGSRKKKK